MNIRCNIKSTLLLLLLLPLQQELRAQESMNLGDCLEKVRNAHPGTQQLVLSEALLDYQTRINNMAYLPQLNLNGKASWQSDVTEIDIPLPGVDIRTPDPDQYAITADLLQPIYDGGITKARQSVIQSENEVSTLQFRLRLQSAEEAATVLFYQLLLQDNMVASQDILLRNLSALHDRLSKNFAAGTVDKQALLEAEIRQSEVRQQKAEAQDLLGLAKYSLALLMDIDTSLFIIHYDSHERTDRLAESFDHRIEVQLLDAQMRLNAAQDLLNRSQYHPRLSLFATAGYGKPGLNFLSDEFDSYAVVGGSLSIPLSQIYTGKASREKQLFEVNKNILDQSMSSLNRDLQIKVLQYKTQITKLRRWLEEDEEIIVMREQLLQISDARLEGGTITTSDYLDALTDLTLAREKKVTHTILLRQNQDLLHLLYSTGNTQNQ